MHHMMRPVFAANLTVIRISSYLDENNPGHRGKDEAKLRSVLGN